LAHNFAVLSAAEGVSRGLTVLTALVAARALGPTLLGEVALAQTLAVYMSSFSDGGLTLLTYRRIVLAPEKLSRLVVDTTVVQLGLSIFVTTLIVIAALVMPFHSDTRALLIVFAPYTITQALGLLYTVQALERMTSVAWIKIITQVATALPTVTLVLATRDPIWVAAGMVTGQLVGDAVNVVVLRRDGGFRLVKPDISAAPALLRQGRALLGSLLLYNYAASMDVLILSALRTAHDVGEYTAAARLLNTVVALSQVFVAAMMPELVRRHAEGRGRLENLAHRLTALTVRMTLILAAFAIVESAPIIHVLYGGRYATSASLLSIMAIMMPLMWYAHLLGFILVAAGRQRQFFTGLAATAVFTTVSYPVAAEVLGATGISITVCGAAAVLAGTYSGLARRHLGLAALRQGLRQLPYGLVPAGTLLALHWVTPNQGFLVTLPVWILSVVAVEAAAHWPTVLAFQQIRRSDAVS